MKKVNKQILSEELKRFKQINEYDFYVGEELENDDEILLDEDPEDEVEAEEGGELDLDIDDLPDDDSQTAEMGDDEMDAEIDSLEADVETDGEGGVDSLEADIEGAEGGELDIEMDEEPSEDEVELDVTELVNSNEEAKQSIDAANSRIEQLMGMVDNLEDQLNSMSSISNKIDSLENELEKRAPTPEEKLEMRSLDSFPYNLKLTDFWAEKEGTYDVMDNYGDDVEIKDNEYVLTQKEVDDDYNETMIGDTFDENPYDEEDI